MITVPSIETIKKVMTRKGYAFFENGDYDLNIIGIRSATSISDKFDDLILVIYKINNQWQTHAYKATTDPGAFYLLKPLDKTGTIIMVPGQYRGVFKIGIHGRSHVDGGYKALEQVKPFKYVRDKSGDSILNFELIDDPKNIFEGIQKTNLHRASQWKTLLQVGMYSAGCQVLQSPTDFNELIGLAEQQVKHGNGDSFTYTLLKEIDLYEAN